MRRFILCMFLGMTANNLAQAATDFYKARVQIPAGSSVLSIPLSSNTGISPFQVLYTPSRSCVQFTVSPEVIYAGSSNWTRATFNSNGTFSLTSSISGMRLVFDSPYRNQTCNIILKSLADETSTPDKPQRVYAGLVEFAGGFVNQASVAIEQPTKVQYLEVIVPQYCKDLEVLDVGVMSNGVYSGAQELSDRPGLYQLSQPQTVSSLEISMVGPQGQNCQIPLYLYPERS